MGNKTQIRSALSPELDSSTVWYGPVRVGPAAAFNIRWYGPVRIDYCDDEEVKVSSLKPVMFSRGTTAGAEKGFLYEAQGDLVEAR